MNAPSPKGISVIICSRNSGQQLQATVRHLKAQVLPAGIPWELVLVDNNSDDDTLACMQRLKADSPDLRITVTGEDKAGIMHARLHGIRTATYCYTIFCDDDNHLAPNYLAVAYAIMEKHPEVGIAGGQNRAQLNTAAPDWFESVQHDYAVGMQANRTGDVSLTRKYIWGAGMVTRRDVLTGILDRSSEFLLSGRFPGSFASGEDTEICKWFLLSGYRLRYDSELKLDHCIKSERLTREYYEKLKEGHQAAYRKLLIYDFLIDCRRDRIKPNRLRGLNFLIKCQWKQVRRKKSSFKNRLKAQYHLGPQFRISPELNKIIQRFPQTA
ncbi:glycosyltransferase [Coraliomargarita parva]|uniref:glycosyltransferase n=1 Tax=Coraliomargarita parva TaxID=3014050 RepID=UPI0022B3AB94|nr:glycosyltransferase [Coraliomargarita parva]